MPEPPRDDSDARRRSGRSRALAPALLLVLTVVLSGCSGNHSTLNPFGPDAGRITALSWFMISLASLITLFVFGLLLIGLFRDGSKAKPHTAIRWVVGGGIIFPSIVLLTLAGLTIVTLNRQQQQRPALGIEVIAHQYWWEVRYPGTDVVTANEVHVPVGRDVEITLRSADVIHSFWVPSLAGKTDVIPGRTNHQVFRADSAGTFRGQCAEFCGIQHAHMAFVVIAQPPRDFQAWLQQQGQPAAEPTGEAAAGRDVFMSQPCAGCHTVRGTPATGTKGPDLTHLASRSELAALTFPNTSQNLARWITNAQAMKPGALMPPIQLTPQQTSQIVAYLEQLK
jgi:cytochrome c oxidase subunit 2